MSRDQTGPHKVIHAMKAASRNGWVTHLSVAFAGAGVDLVYPFWTRLRELLNLQASRYGNFNGRAPARRANFLIQFMFAWPEQLLDDLLKQVATEFGAMIYIEPSILAAEMTTDPGAYLYLVNVDRRRPDN